MRTDSPPAFEPSSDVGLRGQIELANEKLNHWLLVKSQCDGEIERWTQVLSGLEQVARLMQSPASSVNRLPPSNRRPSGLTITPNGKRHIRWATKWVEILRAQPEPPTKKALIQVLVKDYGIAYGTAQQAVYGSISRGTLRVKLDKVYLNDAMTMAAPGAS